MYDSTVKGGYIMYNRSMEEKIYKRYIIVIYIKGIYIIELRRKLGTYILSRAKPESANEMELV